MNRSRGLWLLAIVVIAFGALLFYRSNLWGPRTYEEPFGTVVFLDESESKITRDSFKTSATTALARVEAALGKVKDPLCIRLDPSLSQVGMTREGVNETLPLKCRVSYRWGTSTTYVDIRPEHADEDFLTVVFARLWLIEKEGHQSVTMIDGRYDDLRDGVGHFLADPEGRKISPLLDFKILGEPKPDEALFAKFTNSRARGWLVVAYLHLVKKHPLPAIAEMDERTIEPLVRIDAEEGWLEIKKALAERK